MFYPDFNAFSIELILFIVIGFLLIIKITWLFQRNSKILFFKETEKNSRFSPPVSVIICARNEGDNLTNFLPEILTQDYENYEVIVVNDCSYDNTDDVLREFSNVFPNLKAITVKEDDYYKHGKKFALMVGIKGAKNEYLVLTDADCKPASSQWLKKMAAGFDGGKEIVLGYGPYLPEKGILNKLIRYDAFLIGIKYLSAALRKKPYMGVGRNLAYKKELFFKSKNFSKHYHLVSGDDDLFINQVATTNNTSIIIDKDAFTYSIPKKSWKEWKLQKGRHLTTAPHYNSRTKTMLSMDIIINLLFWSLLIAGLFFKPTLGISLISFLIIIILKYIILINVAKKLNEKKIIGLFWLWDFLLILLYPFFNYSKRIFESSKWMN
ncbi:MAG: glycosyltransferase [Bacteroidota bacterium]